MNISLNGYPIGQVNISNNTNINFLPSDKVEDDVRGYLVFAKNWDFVGVSEYYAKYSNKPIKKIALILESPHIDEFTNNYVPIRPANGLTGKKIEQKIAIKVPALVNGLNTIYAYQIFLMNPVQYQCSCAHFMQNKTNRNDTKKVFRMLFNAKKGNLRGDFINRICAYNPDLVINACTYNLKSIVEAAVKQAFSKVSYHVISHPSVW